MILLILIALFCCIFGNCDSELSDEELYFLMEEERRENEGK